VPDEEERMEVDEILRELNEALRLMNRSALQYALTAGTMFGFEYSALASELGRFAQAELEDVKRLVQKISAIGGEPTTEIAPLRFVEDPREAVEWLIESETEALEELQDAIAPTGREAASEAVEHRLEHMIMRKQEQVDVLIRAARQRGA
jgi:bacterioferritin (cytochrome b1)